MGRLDAPIVDACGRGLRTRWYIVALFGAFVLAPSTAGAATDARPNIVVVMVDDVGVDVRRVWNRMPTIQGLFLRQGIRFANAIGETPLCCPGRAGFLTGQHTHNHGVIENDARLFDPSLTIATRLQDAGYHTLLAGKYMHHTMALVDKTPPGWHHLAINPGGYYNISWWVDGVQQRPAAYSTDVLGRHAVRWIRAAPAARPLFAFLTPFAAHDGKDADGTAVRYQPAPAARHIGDPRCADIGAVRPGGYNEADVSDKPSAIRSQGLVPYGDGWPLQRLCESMLAVDELITKVKAELTARGRLANTIWLLTSDNGMGYGAHRVPAKLAPYTTPIPLWVTWTAGRGSRPRVEWQHVSNIDLAPTLASVARTSMPEADGISFARLLRDRPLTLTRDALLESQPKDYSPQGGIPAWWGVRTTSASGLGPWVYTEWSTGERELYDLVADPDQLVNVADRPDHANTQSVLAARLAELRTD